MEYITGYIDVAQRYQLDRNLNEVDVFEFNIQ